MTYQESRQEEVKLLPFADDMMLCIENHKDATKTKQQKKPLELINEFSKFVECKIDIFYQSTCCIFIH